MMCLAGAVLPASADPEPEGSIPIAKPGCMESCQNSTVKVPFPFGIGDNCYSDPWYEIVCNTSLSGAETPILSSFDVEVLNITTCSGGNCDIPDLRLEVATPWHNVCTAQKVVIYDMDKSPFRMSTSGNQLVVKGCPGVPILMNRKSETVAGCSTVCQGGNTTDEDKRKGNISTLTSCDGIGCCLMSVDQQYLGVDFYQIALRSSYVDTSQVCMEFALMEKFVDPEEKIAAAERILLTDDQVPTVWYWMPPALPEENFTNNHQNPRSFSCRPFCGYYDEAQCAQICTCNEGYEGNPYISDGCQDPCKFGTNHSSLKCKKRSSVTSAIVLGLSIGLGSVVLLLCCYGSYRLVRRWIQIKKRAKFFKRNGGLMLKQQMASEGAVIQSTRVFTARELEKATGNFSSNRIIGQGGQEHIHNPNEDFQITWRMRLQIAAETAGALAYLHSSSSTPIYHRDIKSSNILLDDKYRAKLSDFGTSRTMMIDQTHFTTRIQGTFGYLDPEYFQSNQFTEKSDVYSFGVVLVELITGIKPVLKTELGEWVGLAKEFLFYLETGHLHDILNAQVVEEAKEEELIVIADLAKRCLNLNGKQRPTMKEVANALEGIRLSNIPTVVDEQKAFKGGDHLILEIEKMNDGYVSSTTFFSANNMISTSGSFDNRPLVHNSI
ncbi:hypothetical protein BVRB_9g223180 [Beta vulgaris subsp. vulgaris]|nr:hypothetical protein BVRB_9g223180 [Beta vulgaris subsp. vulgaris]